MKYVCGRPFDTEYGHHTPGDVVEQAPLFANLPVLVSAGLLYPYSPDEGYEYLPPHLFSATNTRAEVIAKIEGDRSAQEMTDLPFFGEIPEEITQAHREAVLQLLARDAVLAQAARNLLGDERFEATRKAYLSKDQDAEPTQDQPALQPAKSTTTQTSTAKKTAANPKEK